MSPIQQMLLGAGGIPPQECLTTSYTDMFGAHKYTGNAPYSGSYAATNVINNSNLIDIFSSGKQGMLWIKSDDSAYDNGVGPPPGYGWHVGGNFGHPIAWAPGYTYNMARQGERWSYGGAFQSHTGKGFTVYDTSWNIGNYNGQSQDYGAFMWKKSKYYMWANHYTGTGSAQSIDHGLDCVPAVMIIKNIDSAGSDGDWSVYHYKAGNNRKFILNSETNSTSNQYQGLVSDSTAFNSTTPDRFKFHVGANNKTNKNGIKYVCWTFAGNHDEDDFKRFGGSCNEGMIGCNVYTGNHSTAPTSVNLGFNPRCVMTFPQYGQNSYGSNLLPAISANVSNMSETDVYTPGNNKLPFSSNFWQATGSNTFQLQTNALFCNQQGIDYYYLAFR